MKFFEMTDLNLLTSYLLIKVLQKYTCVKLEDLCTKDLWADKDDWL